MSTAIYLRISDDVDLKRAGVKRQLADCEKLCDTNGWAPTVVYEDNDISAYSGKKRPAYLRMIGDVRDGTVTRIVAWHPERLHRSTRELEDFIDLINTTGCDVATVTAGHYDLSTATGRMTARVLGAVARGESEHKSERIRRKMLDLAQAGAWVGGGVRPYGYRKHVGVDGKVRLRVDKTEAAVIRDMMRRYLAGQSARSIAADLRERSVPTVNGGHWRTNTVQGILTGGVISAQRDHLGETVAKGDWPAIVTVEDTRNARAVAARNTRTRKLVGVHLLTGLVRCGLCGAGMHAATHSRGATIMRCPRQPNGCGRVTIRRDPLEQLIVEAVLVGTDTTTLPAAPQTKTGVADDLEDSEQQLQELAHAYANRVISMREWVTARDEIQQRIDHAVDRHADTITTGGAVAPFSRKGELRKAWPRLSHEERRTVLAAYIDHILIGAGVVGRNRFDPDRINIVWR